jgi:hypothetical protein
MRSLGSGFDCLQASALGGPKGETDQDRSIESHLVLRRGAHPLPQRRKDARPRRGDPQPGRGLAVSG